MSLVLSVHISYAKTPSLPAVHSVGIPLEIVVNMDRGNASKYGTAEAI